jgi:glycosyltransferase 2 family protein
MDESNIKKASVKPINFIFKSIGIVILLILLSKIENKIIINSLLKLKIKYIIIAIFITAPFFTIKIYRWVYILKKVGIQYSFLNGLKTYGAGLFSGQVTPGQLGELIRSVFMSRKGYDLGLTMGTVIFERSLDLILLLILALPGVILFLDKEVNLSSDIYLLFIIFFIFVYFLIKRFKVVKQLSKSKYFNKIFFKIKINADYLKNILADKKALSLIISMTILAFLVNIIRFHFLSLSLGIDIKISDFIFGIAFVSIVGLIPISIAGIGTRDAAMVLFFSNTGHHPEQAVAFSMLILIVGYGMNIIWGFPCWWLESKQSVLES